MSAFTVSKAHIDAIVSVAIHGPKDAAATWHGPRWAEGDPRVIPWQEQVWHHLSCGGRAALVKASDEIHAGELGNILWAENYASVNYRYDEFDEPEHYISAEPARRPTTVETLSLLACLDYQSCEHPGWIDSEAFRFCAALRDCLIGVLPGYSDAPWEWSTPVTA